MSTSRIVYNRPDGGVTVLIPNPAFARPGEAEADWLARLAAKDVPAGLSWRIIDVADLPASRTFRDAWKDDGKATAVHMPAARLIHLARIRLARDARLGDLDRDWMRATGQGRTGEAVVVESIRQTLRDLPQTADLSQFATPEDLAAFWPAELGEQSVRASTKGAMR